MQKFSRNKGSDHFYDILRHQRDWVGWFLLVIVVYKKSAFLFFSFLVFRLSNGLNIKYIVSVEEKYRKIIQFVQALFS